MKHASDINTFGNKFTDAIRDKAGRDITYTISKNKKYKASGKCMNELYNVGTTEKGIVGCITSHIFFFFFFFFVLFCFNSHSSIELIIIIKCIIFKSYLCDYKTLTC